MMSLNLSRLYFIAALSSKKGLYFSSVGDVLLNMNPMGCSVVHLVLLGGIVVCFCEHIPVKPYLHPSVVMKNGVLLYFGPLRTGSCISTIFKCRNALSCSLLQSPIKACPFIALLYAALPFIFGKSKLHARSVNG